MLSNFRCHQLAVVDVIREDLVGDAGEDRELIGPRAVFAPSLTSSANRLCICRGVLSAFVFQSRRMLRTFAVLNVFSFFNHPVRPLSTPSVR